MPGQHMKTVYTMETDKTKSAGKYSWIGIGKDSPYYIAVFILFALSLIIEKPWRPHFDYALYIYGCMVAIGILSMGRFIYLAVARKQIGWIYLFALLVYTGAYLYSLHLWAR